MRRSERERRPCCSLSIGCRELHDGGGLLNGGNLPRGAVWHPPAAGGGRPIRAAQCRRRERGNAADRASDHVGPIPKTTTKTKKRGVSNTATPNMTHQARLPDGWRRGTHGPCEGREGQEHGGPAETAPPSRLHRQAITFRQLALAEFVG